LWGGPCLLESKLLISQIFALLIKLIWSATPKKSGRMIPLDPGAAAHPFDIFFKLLVNDLELKKEVFREKHCLPVDKSDAAFYKACDVPQ
jgi:hypothetical protein